MNKFLIALTLLTATGCASTSRVEKLEAEVAANAVRSECTTLTVALMMSVQRLSSMMNAPVHPEALQQEQINLQNLALRRRATCEQAYPAE
jgi:hypothetical protein